MIWIESIRDTLDVGLEHNLTSEGIERHLIVRFELVPEVSTWS